MRFMSFFNKLAGYGNMNNNIEHQIADYLLDDENVIMAFTFRINKIAFIKRTMVKTAIFKNNSLKINAAKIFAAELKIFEVLFFYIRILDFML